MRMFFKSLVIAILLTGIVGSSGLALTNEEIFSQFQFNFITPGARATAMGGAFIGLADDATAVESNPAGLTVLASPEVSLEFKQLAYTAEQVYENVPTSDKYDPETGIWGGEIIKRDFDDSVESLSFVSVVYPYKRFVFSLYRQELVNYKSSYRTSQTQIAIPGTTASIYPIDASVELTVTNYGIGAALQISETLSLAVSPRWAEMNLTSYLARFKTESFPERVVTDFSDDDIRTLVSMDDGDGGFCVNAGALWKPHSKVSLGVVYRSGARFTVTGTDFGGIEEYEDISEFTLKVPDSLGAGVAIQAADFLTFTLDILYIQYKDLLEDYDIATSPHRYTKNNFTVNNVTEIHAGAEYLLKLGERFLAVRAGFYHEPDHTIRFTGTTGNDYNDLFGRIIWPGGQDQIHVTGGLGLVVNERLQVDAAANIADRFTQLSISAVYRF